MSGLPDPIPPAETGPGMPENQPAPPTPEEAASGNDLVPPQNPLSQPSEPLNDLPRAGTSQPAPAVFSYYPPPPERIPHIGHLAILGLLALCAWFLASLIDLLGVHYHLFGVTSLQQAATEIHFTLGTEAILYILTLIAALLVFPLIWGKSFLEGLQWHGSEAVRRFGWLLASAAVCFGLALFSSLIMPGPADAPIDKMFRAPGAAWVLFAFGVTFAPFFEELAFRGFLLPALCTAFDWTTEKITHQQPLPVDPYDHPMWSFPAMIIASLITSVLFAFLHADQTGYSVGPFLLLMCVSMVLCGARLVLRSLAASVVIHACYNFMLFSLMFFGTSGFRHLDKM